MRITNVAKHLAIVLWLAALFSPLLLINQQSASVSVRFRLTTVVPGAVQVYYDTGRGYTEAQSERRELQSPGGTAAEYTFPLPQARLRAVRIDPLTNPGKAQLEQLRIVEDSGHVLRLVEAKALRPCAEIASLQEAQPGVWAVETTADSRDSSLEWTLTPPVDLRRHGYTLPLRVAWITAALAGLVGLWRVLAATRWWALMQAGLERFPWILGVPMAGIFWLALFDMPLVPGGDLDSSWQQVMAWAAAHHCSWGQEIVFTGGPLSFLNQVFTIEETLSAKLAWDLLGKLALCGLTVAALWRLPWSSRLSIWLVLTFYGWFFTDAVYLFMLTLFLVRWVLTPGARWWQQGLALLAALLLSHIKFTYLLVGAAGIACACLLAAGRRDWRRMWWLPGVTIGGYVASWVALGQPLSGLPGYLWSSWEISTGYPWAMVAMETWSVWLCGVLVLGWLGAGLAWTVWQARDRIGSAGLAIFLSFTLIMAWKHGFTRADGHVLGLFWFGGLVACAMAVWLSSKWRFEWALPVALIGAWLVLPRLMTHAFDYTWGRVHSAQRTVCDPQAFVRSWRQQETAMRQTVRWPRIQAEVGTHTVDMFNYEQGRVLLNGLHYQPRPVFQSYSAYTPALQEQNLHWLQSDRAADYFLWRTSTIDNRYAPADDALLWLELPQRYTLLFSEQDFALLKKRPHPLPGPAKTLLQQQTVPVGRPLIISPHGEDRLWVEVTAQPSLLGRLRAALYRPALLDFVATDGTGRTVRHRLLPKTAQTGFVARPLIESQPDMLAYLQGQVGARLDRLQFEAMSHEALYWGDIEVRIYRLVPAQL